VPFAGGFPAVIPSLHHDGMVNALLKPLVRAAWGVIGVLARATVLVADRRRPVPGTPDDRGGPARESEPARTQPVIASPRVALRGAGAPVPSYSAVG